MCKNDSTYPLKHFFYLITLSLLLLISLPASGADALSARPGCGILSLNGTAFLDADGDGFFSPGEAGLANATVRLMRDGEEIATAATERVRAATFRQSLPRTVRGYGRSLLGPEPDRPGAGYYGVTLSDKPASGLDYGFFRALQPCLPPGPGVSLMRPTPAEADALDRTVQCLCTGLSQPQIAANWPLLPPASYSLLDNLQVHAIRARSGALRQLLGLGGNGRDGDRLCPPDGTSDRFSVQYLDSNYNGGCGNSGACCGGWLESLAGFYNAKGMMCPGPTPTPIIGMAGGLRRMFGCSASTISTNPHYDLAPSPPDGSHSQPGKRGGHIQHQERLAAGQSHLVRLFLPDGSAWTTSIISGAASRRAPYGSRTLPAADRITIRAAAGMPFSAWATMIPIPITATGSCSIAGETQPGDRPASSA